MLHDDGSLSGHCSFAVRSDDACLLCLEKAKRIEQVGVFSQWCVKRQQQLLPLSWSSFCLGGLRIRRFSGSLFFFVKVEDFRARSTSGDT